MTSFRHKEKGTVVEAVKVTNETIEQLKTWTGGQVVEEKSGDDVYMGINVLTEEGSERASHGQYVVLFGNYFDVADGAKFEDTHEPVKPPADVTDVRDEYIMSDEDAATH
jgi:hypothetical protein